MKMIKLLKSKKNAIFDLVSFLLGGGTAIFLHIKSIPLFGLHIALEIFILGIASTGIFRIILPYSSLSPSRIKEIDKISADINRGAFVSKKILRIRLLRATDLYHNNQFRRAQKIMEKLLPLAKTNEEVFSTNFWSAMCSYKFGFYDDATEYFLNCLDIRRDARVLSNLGSCYLKQDIFDEAENCFLQSVALCESDPVSLNGLALTYAKTERYEEALDLAKRSLALENAPYTSYSIAAFSCAMLGKIDESEEDSCERYYAELLLVAPSYAKEFRKTLDNAKVK